jgi:serine/threonine protein kinase
MVDNIKVIKKLGKGAFSECFLCRNYNNNLVAIKKSFTNDKYDGIKPSELREIYCLLKLQKHPNVIPLFEISINSYNEYILIMKYVPLTLDEFIKNYTNREKYIISFIKQMLSIIYYMNINNIIHTDIKSSNILIYYNKDIDDIHIYIIDFGSSNIENITQKYSIVTTYITRAPEIYNYDGNYDSKIDIWSFGMVLYFFIFGKNYLDHDKFYNKTDIIKLQYIYEIQTKINNMNFDNKLKYFLLNIFIVDPIKRPNIIELIKIFEDLYNMKINKMKSLKKLKNIQYNYDISNKINALNIYISSRLNYIKLKNLDVSLSIYNRLSNNIHNSRSKIEILYVCWFINYQFVHKNVDYDLHDILPVFNSYDNKNYSARYLCDLIYDILDDIHFIII